ncbi:MAG: hypothetical protein ACLR13_03225 [Acutalibacteraceae bacterium]
MKPIRFNCHCSLRDNDIDSPDYCDLTNNMPTVAEYWRSQQLKLDGLISGFLGSPEQANVVSDILTHCKAQDSLALVDPIMECRANVWVKLPQNGRCHAQFM